MTKRNFYKGIAGMIAAMFMLLLPIVAMAARPGSDADLAYIKDPANKKVVRTWIKKNYGFVALEKMDRHVLSTWIEDKPEAAADTRIEALRAVWEAVQAPNYENYAVYSTKILTGERELALAPWGEKSSYTSAEVLMGELLANETIAQEFDIMITYANAAGDGAIPIDHAVVELYPADDEGPGYLVDRYFSDQMHEIKDHWRYTYASELFRKILGDNSPDNYETDHIEDPTSYIDSLEERITREEPPIDENCLIADLDLTDPLFTNTDGTQEVQVLPGIMQTWDEVKSALNAAVAYTYDDDNWLACGNSISKTYFPNFCGSTLAGSADVYFGLDCSSAAVIGIDYVSRCAFQTVSPGKFIYYVVAYQENDTGYTCSDYPFDE